MCGIVGLYLKNPQLESRLGELFEPMLIAMTDRGPDSAGFAVYGDEYDDGVKLTLQCDNADYDWQAFADRLQTAFGSLASWFQNANVGVFKIAEEESRVLGWLADHAADLRVMSAGKSIEILKGVGLPGEVATRYKLSNMRGSHAIGHTRMATESAVTLQGSHPFSTGLDLCLVHNGSLSNHNRLRDKLKRQGIVFQTDNDSEVAAGYLTWRMAKGESLNQALTGALKDLDGFFTFTIGTRDGFAVVRDPISCKPAVIAETDDYVAMASEYRALADLPGIKEATVWEPEPAKIYVWERDGIKVEAA
ncbi:MAG TPA: amidophosphoribosyltransferase [Halomonas sp.]|jgi:amidophosphoribosyltransferase|uniref:class II glutamine amidotransferase n=1 Tax=Halomonadaceae TaxID=28256 RepID=UPI0005CBA270|nr:MULTISPECIES: class II glutamine amidotransferase [Halomonas]KJD18430.1 amidophosphoribosyltransferase [Halomonas meridiana]MAG53102.1 amidophosphoribosyltransferase [Halomonas sp.]MCO7243967.1 class II glutamine amidotransferase [Halomonas sp. Ps84H-12]HAV44171.1 amidophosphoribosyltransferase [Halomonas sp.]HBM42722.1 amidophosphoribosyltransferase [Halomonas sp.]|tara:strand:- start:7551 stop:8468 length:918 start_codon:yes stop_codon:yes gene_type:complete